MTRATKFLVLAALLGAPVVTGPGPVPAFNTAATPLVKISATRVGIRASSSSQSGYMSATQASDLAFVLSGGMSPDPLTATRWSSSNGVDRMTTTALVDSNMMFSGLGGPSGQIQSLGGVSDSLSDSGTRANTTDITGTSTETGGGTWAKSAFCSQGVGVSSNQFYGASGSPDCSDVDTTGADGFTQATLAVAPGENNIGLIFRWNNATNSGYQLLFFNDGNYYVNRYDSGSATTVFTHACHAAPNPGQVMRADYAGVTVTISCNGAVLGTFTDSLYSTQTFSGLYYGSSGGGTTTRITTWSTQGGGADRRVVVSPLSGAAKLEESFTTFQMDHDATIAGQLTSSAAIGTPPFVLTSTTKTVNMNADLLDGNDSTAFAASSLATTVAGLRGYLTLVGFLGVTNGSSDSGKVTVDANTLTPKKCTVELESLGSGAGTCVYSLYDVTTTTLMCSVSVACNSSTSTVGVCTASGTAAANDVLSFRATSPSVGDTTASLSTLTCSFTQ